MPPSRLVHVVNNLVVGGAERFLVGLAAAQRERGHEVTVVTLVGDNPLAPDLAPRGVAHVALGRRRLNDPRLVLDLHRALGRLRPEVVHSHLFYADTAARLASILGRAPVLVSTEHSTEGGGESRRRLWTVRATARRADRIVAVSEAVRARAAARLGLPPERIDVIHNGIDVAVFEQAEPMPREALGLAAEHLVVGCVGRLVEAKGYDVLLEALPGLRAPHLRVLVAGDGPERDALAARAARLGVADRVRFLGTRRDIPRLLGTCDLFVMPSRWEGQSIALLEALAAGRACLASDIPEIRELAADACAYVPPEDPAALAGALAALLADPARRRDLAARARARAQGFAIAAVADRYLDLYHRLLNRRR